MRVRFDGVSKRFGAHAALRGIDLEIEEGECLVLLGPSGCGKTTLLRLVAGLERVDEGAHLDRRSRRQRSGAGGAGRRDGVSELSSPHSWAARRRTCWMTTATALS